MNREKTKYTPFGVYEYEYMEAWLEDLARKGWILKSMFSCFATFEETEPRELRFRTNIILSAWNRWIRNSAVQ